ncbi:MAG: hypothetical protein ACFHU9_05940 [Fluviicola sp.]
MKVYAVIASLFITTLTIAQDGNNAIAGEWFRCDDYKLAAGDTLVLQGDSCIIHYEHKSGNFTIQVVFEFAKDHFSMHSYSEVIGGSSYHHYWEITEDSHVIIGSNKNEIFEQYELLEIGPMRLTLRKIK